MTTEKTQSLPLTDQYLKDFKSLICKLTSHIYLLEIHGSVIMDCALASMWWPLLSLDRKKKKRHIDEFASS